MQTAFAVTPTYTPWSVVLVGFVFVVSQVLFVPAKAQACVD
jgi:hypothetical protein